MSLKISLSDVQDAQRVVADAIQEMNAVARHLVVQAGVAQTAMRAPAGRITAEAFDRLGGGGRALSETLAALDADLSRMQRTALQGSDEAARIASSAVPAGGSALSPGSAAVVAGM